MRRRRFRPSCGSATGGGESKAAATAAWEADSAASTAGAALGEASSAKADDEADVHVCAGSYDEAGAAVAVANSWDEADAAVVNSWDEADAAVANSCHCAISAKNALCSLFR